MSVPEVRRAVEAAFRTEWGRVVATVIRRTGDWDLAEECAQEAFAEALQRWPVDGVPRRPGAWLTTVAGNRAIDRRRRAMRGAELLEQLARATTSAQTGEGAMAEVCEDSDHIADERLRLMFTCCHPALPMEGRVALTLRSLGGLTTGEIARAFLVPEPTMAKRLTRAKAKIAAARIPFRVPPAHLLPERTAGVLAVLYLMFNQGYDERGQAPPGTPPSRADLCAEALRLTRMLRQLMPDQGEVIGLLALLLLQHSRRAARTDADGNLVTLEEQDRNRWDHTEIREGLALVRSGPPQVPAGPYQVQAAIAACHARAADAADTDWGQIARLYDVLEELVPSPVVRLNRAVAVAMTDEIDTALALLDELADDRRLARYHLMPATRADLLRRSGRLAAASVAYDQAIRLAPTEVERRYLERRRGEVRTRIAHATEPDS